MRTVFLLRASLIARSRGVRPLVGCGTKSHGLARGRTERVHRPFVRKLLAICGLSDDFFLLKHKILGLCPKPH